MSRLADSSVSSSSVTLRDSRRHSETETILYSMQPCALRAVVRSSPASAWEAFLAALFRLVMTEEEAEICRQYTRRSSLGALSLAL